MGRGATPASVIAVLHRVLRLAGNDLEDADVPFPATTSTASRSKPSRTRCRWTCCTSHHRHGLRRRCRYGAVGPVAESPLRKLNDGRDEDSPTRGTLHPHRRGRDQAPRRADAAAEPAAHRGPRRMRPPTRSSRGPAACCGVAKGAQTVLRVEPNIG